MRKKKIERKNPNDCPICGEPRFVYGKQRLCPICDEYALKIRARDALRRNKKNIEQGLIKSCKAVKR